MFLLCFKLASPAMSWLIQLESWIPIRNRDCDARTYVRLLSTHQDSKIKCTIVDREQTSKCRSLLNRLLLAIAHTTELLSVLILYVYT